MLGRWLDPPAVIERKRAQRAAFGSGRSGQAVPFEVGCFVPIALAIAVLVGAGVLVGSRLAAPAPAERVLVRVVDDGAPGGPAVVSTASVPLR